MADRVEEMTDAALATLAGMARQGRKPGTDAAGDIRAALLARWPDLSPFEFAKVTISLAERLERAERMLRPANANSGGRA